MEITTKELKKIISASNINCSTDCVSINIDKTESNGILLNASLDNDFHFEFDFWLDDSTEIELTETQIDLIFNLLETSLGEHKQSAREYQQESIYDAQFHALSLIA